MALSGKGTEKSMGGQRPFFRGFSSFPCLLPQTLIVQSGGGGRRFMAGLEMQTVYNILFMSSFEKKERFLGKFYLRLNEKNKHWLLGSLGCGLFLEKWDWERLSLRAPRPHSPALLAPGGM